MGLLKTHLKRNLKEKYSQYPFKIWINRLKMKMYRNLIQIMLLNVKIPTMNANGQMKQLSRQNLNHSFFKLQLKTAICQIVWIFLLVRFQQSLNWQLEGRLSYHLHFQITRVSNKKRYTCRKPQYKNHLHSLEIQRQNWKQHSS
jgi:hypothetical protein